MFVVFKKRLVVFKTSGWFQINNFRTINDMKKKSKKTDIYIKPDITKFTVVSFDDGRQIIENGLKAA